MLNKLTAFNLLDKSKMLKPYPDILKSQYTLLQKTNVPSKLAPIQKGTHDNVTVFWLEPLHQQISNNISYRSSMD